jgi:hypothetical protein
MLVQAGESPLYVYGEEAENLSTLGGQSAPDAGGVPEEAGSRMEPAQKASGCK